MSMETRVLPITEESLEEAAERLRRGEVVAMPTETVYGLGANALDAQACLKIFEAKGRPADNPLIVHISCWEELSPLVREIDPRAVRLAEKFWPGPLTMIFPRAEKVPAQVSAGLDTLAVRMPAHPVARALIEKAGVPIAAPSANRSGKPSPTTAQHVLEDMDGIIPLILDGGSCDVGVESTVLDLTRPVPVLLRPGGVTAEMLLEELPDLKVDAAVLSPLKEGQKVLSPGMKYKHYAPNAHVTVVKGTPERIARLYDEAVGQGKKTAILCADAAPYGDRVTRSMGKTAGEVARVLSGQEPKNAVNFKAIQERKSKGGYSL